MAVKLPRDWDWRGTMKEHGQSDDPTIYTSTGYGRLHIVLHNEIHSAAFDVTTCQSDVAEFWGFSSQTAPLPMGICADDQGCRFWKNTGTGLIYCGFFTDFYCKSFCFYIYLVLTR